MALDKRYGNEADSSSQHNNHFRIRAVSWIVRAMMMEMVFYGEFSWLFKSFTLELFMEFFVKFFFVQVYK